MKITLTRSGGFTGIPQKKIIDTTTLSPEKAKEIEKLVHQSDLFTPQRGQTHRSAPTTAQPDRFTYNISIDHQGINRTTDIHESSLNSQTRKLIEYLQNT